MADVVEGREKVEDLILMRRSCDNRHDDSGLEMFLSVTFVTRKQVETGKIWQEKDNKDEDEMQRSKQGLSKPEVRLLRKKEEDVPLLPFSERADGGNCLNTGARKEATRQFFIILPVWPRAQLAKITGPLRATSRTRACVCMRREWAHNDFKQGPPGSDASSLRSWECIRCTKQFILKENIGEFFRVCPECNVPLSRCWNTTVSPRPANLFLLLNLLYYIECHLSCSLGCVTDDAGVQDTQDHCPTWNRCFSIHVWLGL
eukprot:g58095.t1